MSNTIVLVSKHIGNYSRVDLLDITGAQANIKKGDTFRVSAEVGQQLLTGEAYVTYSEDGDPIPWFDESNETKPTFDFTVKPQIGVARDASTDENKPVYKEMTSATAAPDDSGKDTPAAKAPARSQRVPRK